MPVKKFPSYVWRNSAGLGVKLCATQACLVFFGIPFRQPASNLSGIDFAQNNL